MVLILQEYQQQKSSIKNRLQNGLRVDFSLPDFNIILTLPIC